MRAVFKWMGRNDVVIFLDGRLATEHSMEHDSESVWTKIAVLWGAETDHISSRIKDEGTKVTRGLNNITMAFCRVFLLLVLKLLDMDGEVSLAVLNVTVWTSTCIDEFLLAVH